MLEIGERVTAGAAAFDLADGAGGDAGAAIADLAGIAGDVAAAAVEAIGLDVAA